MGFHCLWFGRVCGIANFVNPCACCTLAFFYTAAGHIHILHLILCNRSSLAECNSLWEYECAAASRQDCELCRAGVVVLGITIGMGYSIEFLFFDETYRSVFYALIPLRIFPLYCLPVDTALCLKYKKEQENNDEEINGRNRETENKQNEPENNRKETENVRNESDNGRNESENTSVIERIAVKSGTKIHVVPIAEVLCLVADGDYVQVVTEKGKFLKEQTMKYFETQLPQNQFIRVHRSCIVNVEAISRIELYEKQSQQVMLKNGDKIKLSQAGYKLLREKLRL
jgi:hypothetical protein